MTEIKTRNIISRSDLPADFIFGTATSSYQIEGTRFGTCGASHWDSFAKAGGTANFEDGETACAHYEKWEDDLNLIQDCGLQAYRFSVAWPRIFPDAAGSVNEQGLAFYDRVVDGLLARGIEPHLTLYHWDLPQYLADNGGWTNQDTTQHFGDYTEAVMHRLGDRLKSVATINEPWCVAWLSHYLGHHAPGLTDLSAAGKAMHNILLAHGRSLDRMRSMQSVTTDSNLGIVLNMEVSTPSSDDPKDIAAAQIQDGIYNRWFADAVFTGTYPADVLEHLEPHLPANWQDDMPLISKPIDWLGLNYYTRNFIKDDGSGQFPFGGPVVPESAEKDPTRTSMNWEVFPEGLTYFLTRIEERYAPNIPIIVSENGMASFDEITDGKIDDVQRVAYLQSHISAVNDAIHKGAHVKGYFAWSLLDNFEWAFGYDQRFGIVHVDFETQVRTPKASWQWLRNFLGS